MFFDRLKTEYDLLKANPQINYDIDAILVKDNLSWKDYQAWHKEQWPEIKIDVVKMQDKRVHWLQFIGNEILLDTPSPLPYEGYSVVPCFAYADVSKRSSNHFGIVRLMKDAQREVNKRWSQTGLGALTPPKLSHTCNQSLMYL